MKHYKVIGMALAGAIVFSGSAAAESGDVWDRLTIEARICTEKHAFDPRNPGDVGVREVSDNELAWRGCVYDRIREVIMPKSPTAKYWQALIDEDRTMTAAIKAGEITRSQRAVEVQALVTQIHLAEAMALTQEAAKTDKSIRETEERLRMMDEIERIRRSAAQSSFF